MGDMLIKVPMQHEPKRKNRYFAHFGTDIGIETWAIRKFKRPSMKINKIEIPYMNEQNYVAGRYTWDSVNVTFLDPKLPFFLTNSHGMGSFTCRIHNWSYGLCCWL